MISRQKRRTFRITLPDLFLKRVLRSLSRAPFCSVASHLTIGLQGERKAASYIRSLGYVIVRKNWRHPQGEIDIIARDGETLVFIEVKTRQKEVDCYFPALDAIDIMKERKLMNLAKLFLRSSPSKIRRWKIRHYRFDAITV